MRIICMGPNETSLGKKETEWTWAPSGFPQRGAIHFSKLIIIIIIIIIIGGKASGKETAKKTKT
jgi:hypothetical protein